MWFPFCCHSFHCPSIIKGFYVLTLETVKYMSWDMVEHLEQIGELPEIERFLKEMKIFPPRTTITSWEVVFCSAENPRWIPSPLWIFIEPAVAHCDLLLHLQPVFLFFPIAQVTSVYKSLKKCHKTFTLPGTVICLIDILTAIFV